MIAIDFAAAVTVFASFIPMLVLWKWIFYNCFQAPEPPGGDEDFEQCPYCTYIFFDVLGQNVKACPRCHSLIAGEDKPAAGKRVL